MQEQVNEMNKRWAGLNDAYNTLTTLMYDDSYESLLDIYKTKMCAASRSIVNSKFNDYYDYTYDEMIDVIDKTII